MSYLKRHRWFGRMALGLAVASVMFVGRASVAPAKMDPGTHGSGHVKAGGWSGMVDLESGVPLSAGIPLGDDELIDGILTQDEADATARTNGDPYRTDVNVRPGESLGGPDGGPAAPRPALESKGTSAKADPQADIERMRRIWTDRD